MPPRLRLRTMAMHGAAMARHCAQMSTGFFLLTTKMTGKRGLGLAACTAGNVLNCIKAIIDADKVGLNKPALGVWAAVSAAIGLLAFKNQ